MKTEFEAQFGRLSLGELPNRKGGYGLYDANGGQTVLKYEIDGSDGGIFDARDGSEVARLFRDKSGAHMVRLKGKRETFPLPSPERVERGPSPEERLYAASKPTTGNTLITVR